MKKQQIIILVALLTVLLSVNACGCLGGGKKKEKAAPAPSVQSETPTTGQEAIDLKKAHDEKALTDEEYKEAKEKLLKEGEQPTKESAEQPKQEQKETEEKAK